MCGCNVQFWYWSALASGPCHTCLTLPPIGAQDLFVRAYLEVALAQQPGHSLLASAAGEAALEEAARQLVAAANAYVPVSHLLWGLWGLIQVWALSPSVAVVDALAQAPDLIVCVASPGTDR